MPMEHATQRDEPAITRWREVWVESAFGAQNPHFRG